MKTYYKIKSILDGYTIVPIESEDDMKFLNIDVFPSIESAENRLKEMGYIKEKNL